MKSLYTYRGWILGALAVALLAMPSVPFPVINQNTLFTDQVLFAVVVPVLVFVVSILLRVLARRSIGEHTRGYTHDADRLVTDGVYSRIRHPLYVSNTGVGYSFILFHLGLSLYALPFVVVLVSFEIFLARMEDRYLEKRFGEEWRKWSSCTPAFFPRCVGAKFARGTDSEMMFKSRSFAKAFCADFSTWIWLTVFIAILVARKII